MFDRSTPLCSAIVYSNLLQICLVGSIYFRKRQQVPRLKNFFDLDAILHRREVLVVLTLDMWHDHHGAAQKDSGEGNGMTTSGV